jgi:hypothetical protein
MGTKAETLKRIAAVEKELNIAGIQHRTFVGAYTYSDDPEIQARSEADLEKLKAELGVTERDVCVMIKHFYGLRDEATSTYYATDETGGKYQPPTLYLADWHARYDLIFHD